MNKRATFDAEAEVARRRELVRIAREEAYRNAWMLHRAKVEGWRPEGFRMPVDVPPPKEKQDPLDNLRNFRAKVMAATAKRRKKVLALCRKHMTINEIARELGVSVYVVGDDRRWLKEAGEDIGPSRPSHGTNPDIVARLVREGKSNAEIARMLGRGIGTIQRVRRRLGIVSDQEAESQRRSDLLRTLHAKGMTDAEIAERMNLTLTAVHKRRSRLGLPRNTVKP